VNGRGLALVTCSLALCGALASRPAAALDVARGEIESTQNKTVVFVNYEGPEQIIQSLADIKGIGIALGRQMAAGALRTPTARYQVIRAADPKTPQGFDADILVLAPDAQVDHIRNLRWIIAGYLEAAWGYAENDAFTLATFITVYNAVYRGDMAYISSKYKPVVQKELSADNAGLALVYSEWAGKSRILIPLGAAATPGALGAVNTGAVASPPVTESMRSQPDKGIADRQAMTDLKEREAAQKQAEVDKQKADLAAAQQKLAADQAAAEAARAKLEADKAAAAAAQAPAGAQAAQGSAAGTQGAAQSAELANREAAVGSQEQAVAAEKAQVTQQQAQVQAGQEAVAAKQAEAAQERQNITQDQKAVIAAEVAAKGEAAAAGLYLFQVVDPVTHLARIVFLNGDSGSLIRSSRVNTIHPRSLVDAGDSFVAVAGVTGHSGGVRLVKLDKTSLEDVADASTEAFPDGMILFTGGAFYAPATGAGGAIFLARYDGALKETARSTVKVDGYAVLAAGAGGIIVQEATGAFAVLKADSLELVKELKP